MACVLFALLLQLDVLLRFLAGLSGLFCSILASSRYGASKTARKNVSAFAEAGGCVIACDEGQTESLPEAYDMALPALPTVSPAFFRPPATVSTAPVARLFA